MAATKGCAWPRSANVRSWLSARSAARLFGGRPASHSSASFTNSPASTVAADSSPRSCPREPTSSAFAWCPIHCARRILTSQYECVAMRVA